MGEGEEEEEEVLEEHPNVGDTGRAMAERVAMGKSADDKERPLGAALCGGLSSAASAASASSSSVVPAVPSIATGHTLSISTGSVCEYGRFIDPYRITHEDFDVKSKDYDTFRVADYSWREHAYILIEQYYDGAAQLLDEQFDQIRSLTYKTFSGTLSSSSRGRI